MAAWFEAPNAPLAFCIALDALRSDEGHSVEVLSDDPEASTVDEQSAVEVCGDWTGWDKLRFYGRTPLEAVLAAGAAQAKYR